MSDLLRQLPAVHELADAAARLSSAPRWAVVEAARRAVAERRGALLAGQAAEPVIAPGSVAAAAERLVGRSLRRVLNATGVVIHTNLGRAPLAPAALDAVVDVGRGYSNLEYDLGRGQRGSRHDHVGALLAELTGAEAGLVVNNNAAATVLALGALAAGREVVVSRGELVEIGGSYRIPDILALSGCRLVEVGTTNKTRLADYQRAIGADTALLLKVHRSNFAIVGFTEETSARALATLAQERGLASMVDLGSGALLPAAEQRRLGLPVEPSVGEVVASGADVVCFSGDKLLGGPQAGLLVGSAATMARLRAHPLMRALRPDKLTLAALEATLRLYRDGQASAVPVLAALAAPAAEVAARAEAVRAAVGVHPGVTLQVCPSVATVGGGAMPTSELASCALVVRGPGPDALDARLRAGSPPVVGRIDDDALWLDVRTIGDDDVPALVAALTAALQGAPS
ncbi:MAG: L-seryl-tRNA(Sec) selenium transferase [Kofleriaceae bacterium]|jgi:L-seryl-tRNA(Ser) seleniumtransferase|nr:L-seryl-tRNA(Sec) selenium transferase [Kofleriaceae bacterium]